MPQNAKILSNEIDDAKAHFLMLLRKRLELLDDIVDILIHDALRLGVILHLLDAGCNGSIRLAGRIHEFCDISKFIVGFCHHGFNGAVDGL